MKGFKQGSLIGLLFTQVFTLSFAIASPGVPEETASNRRLMPNDFVVHGSTSDSAGNIFYVGSKPNPITALLPQNARGADTTILKLDTRSGKILWTFSTDFGGNHNGDVGQFAKIRNGLLYVAVTSIDGPLPPTNGTAYTNNAYNSDAVIAAYRLDNGELVTSFRMAELRSFQGGATLYKTNETLNDFEVDSAGNVYPVYVSGQINLMNGNVAGTPFWITKKISPAGKTLWSQQVVGDYDSFYFPGNNSPKKIFLNSNQTITVLGTVDNTLTYRDARIVTYQNQTGAVRFDRLFSETENSANTDSLFSADADEQKIYMLTGCFDHGYGPQVIALDRYTLQTRWEGVCLANPGGSGSAPSDLKVGAHGNLFLFGTVEGYHGANGSPTLQPDIFVGSINSQNGIYRWMNLIPDMGGYDQAGEMKLDADENVFVTGRVYLTHTNNDIVYKQYGSNGVEKNSAIISGAQHRGDTPKTLDVTPNGVFIYTHLMETSYGDDNDFVYRYSKK